MSDMLDAHGIKDLLGFARYLSWSDLVHQAYETEIDKRKDTDTADPVWGPDFAWMSYWYSSLFVVVEAYESIRYRDQVIDALLAHPSGYKDLLRRYRNGIYHYQPDLTDSRLLNLLNTQDHVLWAHVLHREFRRLLREKIERSCDNDEVKAELKGDIHGLTGYHPDEPMRRRLDDALERALNIVSSEPSPALREQHSELQAAVGNLTEAIISFEEKYETRRRDLLRRLGISIS